MDSAPRAQTKIISVEGLIASGKSTFLDILKTKCPNFFIVEEPVSLFQKYKDHNPLNELPNNAFATQCHIMRTLKAYHSALLPLFKEHNIVVMERFPDSHKIFVETLFKHGDMTSFEHDLFLEIFEEIMKPLCSMEIDGVFYLSVPPKECMKRVVNRNRLEERDFVTVAYLENLESSYDAYFTHHPNIPLWSAVHDTNEPQKLVDELLEFISYVKWMWRNRLFPSSKLGFRYGKRY